MVDNRKADVVVEPRPDGRWARQKRGARRAASLHDTQAGAEAAARAQAKRERTGIVVKGRDGRVERRESYGDDAANVLTANRDVSSLHQRSSAGSGPAGGTDARRGRQGGAMTELDKGSDGDERPSAAEAASTAAEQTKQVVGTASESAKEVAQTAKVQASQVASEVADQGKNLLYEAKDQLSSQARAQTDQFSQAMRRVSDQARALADGRADEAGALGDYTRQAATKLSDLASHVDERGFEGVLRDVQAFAQRRPGTFLLGAAVAGFAIGRVFRGAAAANADQPSMGVRTNAIPSPATGNRYASPSLELPLGVLDPGKRAASFDPTTPSFPERSGP